MERRIRENLLQTIPIFRYRGLCLDGFGQRADHVLIRRAVSPECYAEYEIVIRLVDHINGIKIEGLDTGDALVKFALLDQCICQAADKHTEDISDAEMHPDRCLLCIFCNLHDVIARNAYTNLLPGCTILQSF